MDTATETLIATDGSERMPATEDAVPDAKPLEHRADVDSLEALHHQRRQLGITLDPLKALHGPFGLFDARRKIMLESAKIRVFNALTAANEKTPEWRIDAEGHADGDYIDVVEQGITDRVEYLRLQREEQEIEEKIRSREEELRSYNSELRLAR